MEIKIDKSMKRLTQEEMDEMAERAKTPSPEEMHEGFKGVKEVILSEQVMEQLKAMGLTPDEVVAMLLKQAKLEN